MTTIHPPVGTIRVSRNTGSTQCQKCQKPLPTAETPRVRGAKSARSPFVTSGTAYSARFQENKAGPGRAVNDLPPNTTVLSSKVSA